VLHISIQCHFRELLGMLFSRFDGLMKDQAKLQSYIDNALTPIVKSLKNEPGLGGYDVINEPSGTMIPGRRGSSSCDQTIGLGTYGMGWVGRFYTPREIQR